MARTQHPLTASQRIAWAISESGKTLVAIAAEIGCSHAALSQWSTGKTEAENIKAGLLNRFADATHVEMRWLLTGQGPVRTSYPRATPLLLLVREVDELGDEASQQAERVLRALLPGGDSSGH